MYSYRTPSPKELYNNSNNKSKKNKEYLKNNIYYEQFIDYWILEVFVGNYDWLSNNIKYFRPRSGEDKWRWLIWDLDHGFGSKLSVDGVNWGDPNTDFCFGVQIYDPSLNLYSGTQWICASSDATSSAQLAGSDGGVAA